MTTPRQLTKRQLAVMEDVISMRNLPVTRGQTRVAKDNGGGPKDDGRRTGDELAPETASRLLAALTGES